MFLSKFTTTTLLFTPSAFILQKKFNQQLPQCDDKQAEKGAKDLDAIFAQAEGGIPPDPEEIQELIMKAQGKTIRKPPQFQRMMMGLKLMTMMEPMDGFKFEVSFPLSQRFQLGGSWVFSNTKANKFELHSALTTSPSSNNPMMSQDDISFISTRSDTTGKLEAQGIWNLGNNFSIRPEMFFMNSDLQQSHVQFEFMKEFQDSHISYKLGGGSHSLSMMQTINSKLMAGFEMYYIPHTKDIHFCYGANYNQDIHSFFAQYIPIARKETLSFGYIGRPSKRLTLFSELKGSLEGFSDTLFGFRVKFMEGMITGTISSSFKATSVYKHFIENILVLSFQSSIDFNKPDKPAQFGVSLSIGGM